MWLSTYFTRAKKYFHPEHEQTEEVTVDRIHDTFFGSVSIMPVFTFSDFAIGFQEEKQKEKSCM